MGWKTDGTAAILVVGASTGTLALLICCVAYRMRGFRASAMDKLNEKQHRCSKCGSSGVQAVLFQKDTTDKKNESKILFFCVKCKPDDDEHNIQSCSICLCFASPSTGLHCTGRSHHFICESCFQGYARTAFEEGTGKLARRIEKSSLCISNVGELPCPLFPINCGCAALSRSSVAKVLTEENLHLQAKAEARIAVSIADEERRQQQQAMEEREAKMRPGHFVRQAVIEALDLGRRMTCPGCRIQGEKDDLCIHMSCGVCRVRWCYACGRERGKAAGNCDTGAKGSGDIFLESNLGWGGFHLRGENRAKGALHEFHRRRMAYFLRLVKETSGADYWQEFLDDASNNKGGRDLLVNVPTRGRRIYERELHRATPPVFGLTKVQDLRWDAEMQPILERLRNKLAQPQQHRQTPAQITPNERTSLIKDVLSQESWLATERERLLNQLLDDAQDSDSGQEERSCIIQ